MFCPEVEDLTPFKQEDKIIRFDNMMDMLGPSFHRRQKVLLEATPQGLSTRLQSRFPSTLLRMEVKASGRSSPTELG